MTLDEAGCLQEAWKTKNGQKPCHHSRVVDYLFSKKGRNTGYLVCKECGDIHLDPVKRVSASMRKTLQALSSEQDRKDSFRE